MQGREVLSYLVVGPWGAGSRAKLEAGRSSSFRKSKCRGQACVKFPKLAAQ